MTGKDDIYLKAKSVFTNYIKSKRLRNTRERDSILDEIYNLNKHFNVEIIYKCLIKKKFIISKTTIYNTLKLLIDCNLIVEHKYNKTTSFFEIKTDTTIQGYLICENCNRIIEFSDPRVNQIRNKVAKLKGFAISHHLMYLHGFCKKCSRKKNKLSKKISDKYLVHPTSK